MRTWVKAEDGAWELTHRHVMTVPYEQRDWLRTVMNAGGQFQLTAFREDTLAEDRIEPGTYNIVGIQRLTDEETGDLTFMLHLVEEPIDDPLDWSAEEAEMFAPKDRPRMRPAYQPDAPPAAPLAGTAGAGEIDDDLRRRLEAFMNRPKTAE